MLNLKLNSIQTSGQTGPKVSVTQLHNLECDFMQHMARDIANLITGNNVEATPEILHFSLWKHIRLHSDNTQYSTMIFH
jgi:hypothetical protein